MSTQVKQERLAFLRLLSYLEQGYSFEEVDQIYQDSNINTVDVIYGCLKDCNEILLMEIIWYLVTESMWYAILDIAEQLEIEEEEMYWL